MSRAAVLAAVTGLALALAVPSGHGAPAAFEPQAKINHVDVSAAPRVRIFASLLDKRLKSVPEDWIEEVSVSVKPDGEKPVELFTLVDGEPTFPKKEGEEPPPEEEWPTMALAGDDEAGMAAVVVLPGFADPSYRDGALGERMRNGAALFFKKLGGANQMNVVSYNAGMRIFVKARGRTRELTRLTDSIREQCHKWELMQLEAYGEPPPEASEELGEDEAYCGLVADYGDLGKIVKETTFQGTQSHLFGLGLERCKVDRREGDAPPGSDEDEDEEAAAGDLDAVSQALQMLIADADPGQPRVLVLLGDGKDGFIQRLDECKNELRKSCIERNKTLRAIRRCTDEAMDKLVIGEQQRFSAKVGRWIALAKAAGVRIYTVANPNAQEFERDRLAVLAWRTGGTARAADDANELVDKYSDLIDELNGQLALSFVDHGAVPGSARSYVVAIKGRTGRFKTPPFEVRIPRQPEGMAVMIADVRAMGEERLGKKGMMAVALGVALVVGLILFAIFFKLLKKVLGKGAKAAKGGKGLKKGMKGAKKGLKGAKKGLASARKVKK